MLFVVEAIISIFAHIHVCDSGRCTACSGLISATKPLISAAFYAALDKLQLGQPICDLSISSGFSRLVTSDLAESHIFFEREFLCTAVMVQKEKRLSLADS